MPDTRKHRWVSLVAWIVASNLAGLIGAAATVRASEFYRSLVRPEWAPPSWVFGPVWTFLYVLMGVAAWLVWRADDHPSGTRKAAITLFIVQLAANALWSWIFFAWRQGALAFAEIIVLAILIVLTMRAFARIDKRAALLLLPYLAWVLFATALTFSIWTGNRAVL